MSTGAFSRFLAAAPLLWASLAAACVTTDVDPLEDSGGASNGGADTSAGGSTTVAGAGGTAGTSEATGAAGTSAAPASGAVFRCEDPIAPKFASPGGSPLIVDFETGALGAPSETGEPSGNFMFSGGQNGGTYTYQEPSPQLMRTVSLVPDRNGGQALSVVLGNATDYGGGMGVYFYPCVDASVYNGITLWARGSLPERMVAGAAVVAGTVTINLDIADVATNSRDSVGCAMDVPTDMTLCTRPSTTFVVSDTWTQFTFLWSDFDPGNKNGTPFIPTGDNLLGINLAMDNAFGMPNDLELSIDDVAFVP
jgi:hypothetical protein